MYVAIHRIMTMRVLLMTMVTLTVAVPMSPAKITKGATQGCPDPVYPKRGIFRMSEDKASVEFLCQPGHALIGQRKATCNNGAWSEQPPVCVGGDCEMPAIRDASITSLHGGGILRIQCRSGFSLKEGTGILKCIDGQWDSARPECIDKTKEMQPGKSGIKNANDVVGRYLKSESRDEPASKRTHKEWLEESDYSCVRRAFTVHPPSVPNARAFTRWAMYDGLPRLYTTYQCKWGFKPRAEGVRNVYCQNGGWVGITPKCQPVVYEEPRQGDFSGLAVALSHEQLLLHADYTCIDGSNYDDIIAPPNLKNTLNGALRFAILEGRPHLYIEYTCEYGLELETTKHTHLYCKEKRWIGEKPKCVPALKSKNSCAFNNGGCSQLCAEDGRRQIVCSCKEGHQLQQDKVSCTDIDECEVNNGGCDHLCDNNAGSFKCVCFPGYALQPNELNCSKIKTDADVKG